MSSISIITTSYNCEHYIESTIKSVIEQVNDVQYIIIDAASSDNTMEVINRYKNFIDVITSEPDDGMYHGIQKGASYVTGEIMAWINADDTYLPWTFDVVNEIFEKYPEVDWIIGQPSYINSNGQCIKVSANAGTAYPTKYIINGWFRPQYAGYLQQESMFWRKSLWDKVNGLDLSLKLAADFDLWRRFASHAALYSVSVPLASFRLRRGEQLSSVLNNTYEKEVINVCEKLEQPNVFWRFVSKKSELLRILSRLLVWKKANLIAYSIDENEWILKKVYRPLSRYSLSEMALEYKLRS